MHQSFHRQWVARLRNLDAEVINLVSTQSRHHVFDGLNAAGADSNHCTSGGILNVFNSSWNNRFAREINSLKYDPECTGAGQKRMVTSFPVCILHQKRDSFLKSVVGVITLHTQHKKECWIFLQNQKEV